MSNSPYTNIAFISYKREDEEWAKWLQKKLEHYKLPTEVRKNNPDLEFVRNPRHVFKDTTDLSSGVLAKAIKEGLDSSKFLIVICSPRAAKSEWVCKEVQDFINSGREEYIIPFIIDGEPYAKNSDDECFPEALKALAGERELLGVNINENGRDSAAVKVIARMFDVRFDTLWNRFQREAKKRRNYILSTFIAAILVLLGIIGYGSWSYLKILSQQAEILEQRDRAEAETKRANKEKDRATKYNNQLSIANDSITKQKNALQKAYDDLFKTENSLALSNADLQRKNLQLKEEKEKVSKANIEILEREAKTTSLLAKRSIEEGNIIDGVNMSLSVLPTDLNKPERPLVYDNINNLYLAYQNLFYKDKPYHLFQGHNGLVNSISYSPNEEKILSAADDGSVFVWNSFSGEILAQLNYHKQSVRHALYSPNGKYIVTSSADGTDIIWNANNYTIRHVLKGNNQFYVAIAFSPDSKYVAISHDYVIHVWNLDDGKEKACLKGHKTWVNSIEFSNDSQKIFSYSTGNSNKNQAIIWDIESQKTEIHITGGFNYATFNPNGKFITIPNGQTFEIWDKQTQSATEINTSVDKITNCFYALDEDKIIFSAANDSTYIFDIVKGKIERAIPGKLPFYNRNSIHFCTISDSKTVRLFSSTNNVVRKIEHDSFLPAMTKNSLSPSGCYFSLVNNKNNIAVWRNDHWINSFPFKKDRYVFSNGTNNLLEIPKTAISPNNTYFAASDMDGTIHIFDMQSEEEILSYKPHSKEVNNMNFSPDSKMILSTSQDGTVRLFDINTKCYVLDTIKDLSWTVFGGFISNTEFVLASWGDLYFCNIRRGLYKKEKSHKGAISCFDITRNGDYLISVSHDNSINIWEKNSQRSFALNGHKERTLFCEINKSNNYVATSSKDGNVIIWDIKNKSQHACLNHHTEVNEVHFSPSDGILLSYSYEANVVYLWDYKTEKCLKEIKNHNGKIWHVEFSQDGKYFMIVTSNEIMIYDAINIKYLYSLFDTNYGFGYACFDKNNSVLSTHNYGLVKLWKIISPCKIIDFWEKEKSGS